MWVPARIGISCTRDTQVHDQMYQVCLTVPTRPVIDRGHREVLPVAPGPWNLDPFGHRDLCVESSPEVDAMPLHLPVVSGAAWDLM